MAFRNGWQAHPAVRTGSELTRGERAADIMRSAMGSWPFVFSFVAFMGGWAALNGRHGVDPFPFVLLNLFLSALAGLQGAILLIAAKRSDQVSSELAQHAFETGERDFQVDQRALLLLELVARKLDVEESTDEH